MPDQTLAPLLPGEDAPLAWRAGRGPVTEDEALGVARRLARRALAIKRPGTRAPIPEEVPSELANRVSSIHRMPPRVLAFARARAELEGRTLTDVVEGALRAYGKGAPERPHGAY
jgi:hypothetical protein